MLLGIIFLYSNSPSGISVTHSVLCWITSQQFVINRQERPFIEIPIVYYNYVLFLQWSFKNLANFQTLNAVSITSTVFIIPCDIKMLQALFTHYMSAVYFSMPLEVFVYIILSLKQLHSFESIVIISKPLSQSILTIRIGL